MLASGSRGGGARPCNPTSLLGDSFQVADAGGQLAGIEPQAATAVRGLLAGPGLDAVAGVLQRKASSGCSAGVQPCPAHGLGCHPPSHSCGIALASC